MLTYIGLYFIFAVCCFVPQRDVSERFYIISAIVFLWIFAGTRLDTGCDFTAYYLRFQSLGIEESFSEVIQRPEPGFWLIAYVVKHLGLEYVWVNVIGGGIFFVCFAKFVLRHPNSTLLLALMFPIMIIQLSMSGLRQALAVGFFMLALLSFVDEKRSKVFIYILVGSIFHQSLVLFLPLGLATGRSFSASRVVAAFAVISPLSLLISAERIDVYNDRYVDQIYGSMESSGALFRLGLLVLSAIAFEVYKDKIRVLFPKEYSLMRLFSLLSFCLIPVALLSTVVVHRLGYYILPIQLYTLALLPFVAFRSLDRMTFGQVFPIGVYAAYIVVWFSLSRHASICYVPYQTYLWS